MRVGKREGRGGLVLCDTDLKIYQTDRQTERKKERKREKERKTQRQNDESTKYD